MPHSFNRTWCCFAACAVLWMANIVCAADLRDGLPGTALELSGKLDPRLIPSVQALLDGAMTADALTPNIRAGLIRSIAPSVDGRLPLLLDVPHVDAATLDAIHATGALVTNSSEKWNSVSCQASLAQIASLVQLHDVRTIALAHKPRTRKQGAADNQADISIKADQARATTGLSGTGQKIGVVSDSINQTSVIGPGTTTGAVPNAMLTGMKNQLSGDLPASIQVVDFGLNDPSHTDEGAAMMELIHDIAPNAALAFGAAGTDQTTAAATLLNLQTAGCNIIVDDIALPDEPFFQDGPIAQAIRANVAAGVTHFSAAGNDGDAGVLANYAAVNPAAAPDPNPTQPSGNFFHKWNIIGVPAGFLPIQIPDGGSISVIMQWNQPYQSFNLGAGSSVDLDVYLYDGTNLTTANTIAFSSDPQFTNGLPQGDPHEIIDNYTNTTGVAQTLYLAVNLAAGSSNNLTFRVVLESDLRLSFPNGGVNGMTAFGHTAMNENISVGAIFYGDIDSKGKWAGDAGDEDPNAINAESFSSKGGIGTSGIPYYFDTAGNVLAGAPQRRNAPSIAAPDRVNTTFFGTPLSVMIGNTVYDGDAFPNFQGTSAAASNAAAVAALLLQRAALSTPAQIKLALQSTASDIVASAPLSVAGPDDRTGSGLINALAAVNAMPVIVTNPVNSTVLEGNTISFSVVASSSATLLYQWLKNGTPISGAISSTLTLTNVPIGDDNSTYSCIVSNAFGSVGSAIATLTVHQGPKITLQPVSLLVNYGATGTFTAQGTSGFITYQWLRNGTQIPGATQPSYTTASVTASDDGTLYACMISNQFASIITNSAKLSANPPPAIVSGPTATPAAGVVGQNIMFSAFAASAHGAPAAYAWNFGDGTSGTGASPLHAYGVAGNYTVTLTVTDANNAISNASLKEIIFIDANGDGLPDLDPAIDNSSYVDAFKTIKGLTPKSLSLKSLSIGLNFAKPNMDSMTLIGSLPIPVAFNSTLQPVIVVVGGVGRIFTLNAKGSGVAVPNGAFKLAFSSKAKASAFGRFSLTLKKASLQSIVLSSSNLANADVNKEDRTVRATIFFNGDMYNIPQPQVYTAKANKTGKTK